MPNVSSIAEARPAPASPWPHLADERRTLRPARIPRDRVVALALAVALAGSMGLAVAGLLLRDGSQVGVPLLVVLLLTPFVLAGLLALMRIAIFPHAVRREVCLLVYFGAGALLASVAPFALAALGGLPAA